MQLQLHGVGKRYEDSDEVVLNGVSLNVEQGEFVCVVGKSGCGKSTLLKLIAGLEQPSCGQMLLNGKPITKPGADRVVMFQDHALFPWLTVEENVKFGMQLAGVAKEVQEELCDKYLDMVQLLDYKKYRIHQLSGGMRQRVALARALTLDSELLLMDEPFSALDKQTSNHLRKELQDIWQKTKKTVFFVTHSVEEAVYLGTKVIVISPETKGIREVIPIALERPRHVYDDAFTKYRHQILHLVQSDL